MIMEGMPWPLVLPVAIAVMIWGSGLAKKEFAMAEKKRAKKTKKSK